MSGLTVTYNNSTIRTSSADDTFTLSCNGKVMASDVVITADGVTSLSATYNGQTILNTSGSGTHTLACNGKVMSSDVGVSVVAVQPKVYPVRGNTITMNCDGTGRTYLVIRITNTIAYVYGRFNINSSTVTFGSSSEYSGSNVDNGLNAWYNTLSDTAKSAIIETTFTREGWRSSSSSTYYYPPSYTRSQKSHGGTTMYYWKNSFGSYTRKVFALGGDDLLSFGTWQNACMAMYGNTERNSENFFWLSSRSGDSSSTYVGCCADWGEYYNVKRTNSYNLRPTFQIDLSKIDFTIN